MTLECPFRNFYDSDFDSRNESSIFEDTSNLLNLAFIASPGSSSSFVYNDVSLSNLENPGYLKKDGEKEVSITKRKLMPRFGDLESKMENFQFSDIFQTTNILNKKREKSPLTFMPTSIDDFQNSSKEYGCTKFNKQCNRDDASENIDQTTDLSKKTEEQLDCVFTSTCLDEFQKPPEEYDWTKFDKLCNEDDESGNTEEITVLSKKADEKPECVFTSTCTDELKNSPEEYDWRIFNTQFNKDDASKKVESKIRLPISGFNYTPRELSTIMEVDSMLMNESTVPVMDSDKHGSLFVQDSKNANILKANDSPEIFNKPKAPPTFPANVIQVIQNKHLEKFLQEPGILEESDLTLISMGFDSTCKISEKSTESYSRGYYKIKPFNVEESPSLISFLQHESICMKECADE